MLLRGVKHTDTSHVGSRSVCWARNRLLSFNSFMPIYSLKLICFNSGATDELTWSTLLPRKLFSLSMVINNLHDVVLGMLHAHGGRVLTLIRKGMEARSGEDSVELRLITVALSSIVPGSFLISLWQEVLWASCAKSGVNAAFLLLFGFLPPQDSSQHSDYLCIFKHGTIYFLKSLMYS